MDKEEPLSIRFLNTYNEIDQYMRKKLNKGDDVGHSLLIDNLTGKDYMITHHKGKLKQYAKLRNAIVHNPIKNADPIAEPHYIIVEDYQKILDSIKNPPKALSIAIQADNIFKANINDNALNIMRIMNTKCFTHVPVFENEEFIGVFSENTVFSYLSKNEGVILDSNSYISEFKDHIPIDKHDSEYFQFISKNKCIYEVDQLFRVYLSKAKRLAVVLITENGKPSEKLLGMITAWDVAGRMMKD